MTIKRTATQLGLKAGEEIRIVRGDYKGIQGTLVECDGSRWPYFKVTKELQDFEIDNRIALYLTNDEGELLFERTVHR